MSDSMSDMAAVDNRTDDYSIAYLRKFGLTSRDVQWVAVGTANLMERVPFVLAGALKSVIDQQTDPRMITLMKEFDVVATGRRRSRSSDSVQSPFENSASRSSISYTSSSSETASRTDKFQAACVNRSPNSVNDTSPER